MKMQVILSVAAMLITASGVCLAQGDVMQSGDGPNKSPTGPKKIAERVAPVAVRLTTDKKTYHAGEPVKMTLTVRNTTKQTQTIPFNSGQKYDFEIRRGTKPNGEKVWQWARGRMFIQMLSQQTLASGKTLTFTETAASADRSNPTASLTLPPGTYKVYATLTTGGRTPRPFDTATIQVK